ncbi:MAG TPA: glycosyltransferase [Kofleriaceae bacterium]|nr:glycosyltransferase [Kofleriaceae bacterium]
MTEVEIAQRDIQHLEPFVGAEALARAREAASRLRDWLGIRRIFTVSSTAVGGGVAEMLMPLLSYAHSLEIHVRWLVIEGDPAFFRVTKRLHHALHGSPGDGSPLDDEARAVYQATSARNAAALEATIRPGDVALLHDPQTAGLVPALAARGVAVLWRCHIGHDRPSPEVTRGWQFLAPWLAPATATIFSRPSYVPAILDAARSHIIQPSIDAMSPKNQPLEPAAVRAIVGHLGVTAGAAGVPSYPRADGSTGLVTRTADILRLGPPPAPDVPLVVQVSRWDPLKDMAGVMRAFAAMVADGRAGRAHLLLVGPDVRGVADDPEGPAVHAATAAAWAALPAQARERIALCMLPTASVEENAIMVNAIQRHAAVVTQKSLHEGFGLTVTEAMWKSRPVVASAVGGIQDQIEPGVHGLLLPDPEDLPGFAALVASLLADPAAAARMGAAAHQRVRERFLGVRHLLQYAALIQQV